MKRETRCDDRACPTYFLTDAIRFSIGFVCRMKAKFLQLVEDRSAQTIDIRLRPLQLLQREVTLSFSPASELSRSFHRGCLTDHRLGSSGFDDR